VLGAVQDPNSARIAGTGLYLMEVFPALALASLGFFGPKAAPHYNPGRKKTFRIHDWERVGAVAAKRADDLGCEKLAEWCRCARAIHEPRKADQDKLDAALCALIALRWRTQSRDESVMLGDLSSGYMVTPATAAVRERLSSAATKCGVAIDGVVPNTLAHI
jgi:predicted RNase H-like nuclease